MPRTLQRDSDGVPAALAIHLCVYCAVGALFALVLYYLMQPTRLPNPGMSGLKSSPTTVSYTETLRSEREAAKRGAVTGDFKVESEPETTGAAAHQASEAKPAPEAQPEAKKAKAAQAQRRTRSAPRPPPAETTHYAQQPYAQPSFDAYRPMY